MFVLAIAAIVVTWFACRFLSQDACLDAGGQWDRDRSICVGIPSLTEQDR